MKIKTSRPVIEKKSNAHGGGHGGGGHHGGASRSHRGFRESDLTRNGMYFVSPSGACFTKNVDGEYISVACGVPSVVMGI